MTQGAREAAWHWRMTGLPDGPSRRKAANALPVRERGLFLELVTGVARRERSLDAILNAASRRGTSELALEVREALRLGLYQILFLDRIPAHAAVHATVDLLPRREERTRGFVNAILRRVARETLVGNNAAPRNRRELLRPGRPALRLPFDWLPDPQREEAAWLAGQWSLPDEAVTWFLADHGPETTTRLLEQAAVPPVISLRVDDPGADLEALKSALETEGLMTSIVRDEDGSPGLNVVSGDPAATPQFKAGRYTVQGPFASRVAPFCQLQPGETAFDVCAGAGGKTLHLAGLVPDARLVAGAPDAATTERLLANADRLQARDRLEPIRIPKAGPIPEVTGANLLLLDVPCSNSGVLARRPEARARLDATHLRDLGELQSRLLGEALDWLENQTDPRARVVYATCSILRRENVDLVRSRLAAHPALAVVAEIRDLPLAPHQDGGYAARITRAE
ncbi:MAG: hypothetical protein KDB53_02435 [Planctomycetes bacterium]|nr:hypothetical protein [Planctomycetota bacterium]